MREIKSKNKNIITILIEGIYLLKSLGKRISGQSSLPPGLTG